MPNDTFEVRGKAPQWLIAALVGVGGLGLGAGGRELAGSSFKDAVAQVADDKVAEVEKRLQSKAEQQLELAKSQTLKAAAEQGAAQLEGHKTWLTEKFLRLDDRFTELNTRLDRLETDRGAIRIRSRR